MTDQPRKKAAWLTWWRDASASAAGSVFAMILFAIAGALATIFDPVRTWMIGLVYLPGWLLVLSLTAAAVVGLWLGRRPRLLARADRQGDTTQRPHGPEVGPSDALAKPGFMPNDLEDRALQMMRLADGKWVSFDFMVEHLGAPSRQDFSESIDRMVRTGWVEPSNDNIYRKEEARRYRLAAQGLVYARERSYPTLSEVKGRKADL